MYNIEFIKMKHNKFIFFVVFILVNISLLTVTTSCNKKDDVIDNNGGNGGEEEPPIDTPEDSVIVDQGWTLTTTFGSLPSYIRVYKSPNTLLSKKTVAYIAVADIDSVDFQTLGNPTGYNKPSDFYAATHSTVILNGGYFSSNASVSLLCRDGKVLCPNSLSLARGGNTYYPTKAAFAQMKDGNFEAAWVYSIGALTYSYPTPAPNKAGEEPAPKPTDLYPGGAVVWEPLNGVGAGPVLINNGEIANTYEEEFFDKTSGVGPTSNNPRSAIGATDDKKIIFFVCEGRGMTEGVYGFTLEEEAQILLSLGCIEAINLDGGGSSCMLINGIEAIQPSDGEQRSIVTAVALN